jgi:hypothetical protein
VPTYDQTTKYALRKLQGSNAVSDVDAGLAALADDVDAIMATDSQGLLANRPTSTPGSPGKAGRYYRATDTGQLFRDHGTGWVEISSHRLYGPLLQATMGAAGLKAGSPYALGINTRSDAMPDLGSLHEYRSGVSGEQATIDLQPPILDLAAADYTLEGLTTKLRVRGSMLMGLAPATSKTFTFGLHPITAAGGSADKGDFTLGAAVAGSTCSYAVTTSGIKRGSDSGDFALPADGLYALGVTVSGDIGADRVAMLAAQLQLRHV